jgi:hypothetical protein
VSVPKKVSYATEDEYRVHFARALCTGPVVTCDGIPVLFRKRDFDHCMYESSPMLGRKVSFSRTRAERIDWIRATLENPAAELFQGWDRRKRRVDPARRVAVVYDDFVVVINVRKQTSGSFRAYFVTAYKAETSIFKIRNKPRWKPW